MKDERGSWGTWFEFLFSALGSLVGLGNIWRYPYICYRSGGGAFLIPFIISLFVCGCPIILLETLICQYSSLGPGRVWIVSPLFRGIGFGMVTLTGLTQIYYTVIMAWTLYYMGISFQSSFPWDSCGHEWNTDKCRKLDWTRNQEKGYLNNSALNLTTYRNVSVWNSTQAQDLSTSNITYMSSEQEFWFHGVLAVTDSIEELGEMRWGLLASLFAAWVVVVLCLIKGIKSLGKVVYIAASLPYVVLICLLIRGCMLPGAGEGIYYYIVPEFEKLLDVTVWKNAATQVFFSVGLGFGVISTLSSYNKFTNNCLRDAYLLPILDCATSVFAGFVIFTYLGYMSHISGKHISLVAEEGPGLVFIAYPAALSTLPLPQLWSVLFFLMLFTVGLDSQFVHVQTVTAALADCFPEKLMPHRTKLTIFVCVVSFLLGIPMTTQGGSYILNLMDWYIASFSVMLLTLIEVLVLAWIYGVERLYQDLEAMIGYRPTFLWALAWKFVTPTFMLALWLSGLFYFQTIGSKFSGYPAWADGLGILIAFLPILPIPLYMAYTLYGQTGSLPERVRRSIQPTLQWKPAIRTDQSKDSEMLDKLYV